MQLGMIALVYIWKIFARILQGELTFSRQISNFVQLMLSIIRRKDIVCHYMGYFYMI